jgi:hypothetical protein
MVCISTDIIYIIRMESRALRFYTRYSHEVHILESDRHNGSFIDSDDTKSHRCNGNLLVETFIKSSISVKL